MTGVEAPARTDGEAPGGSVEFRTTGLGCLDRVPTGEDPDRLIDRAGVRRLLGTEPAVDDLQRIESRRSPGAQLVIYIGVEAGAEQQVEGEDGQHQRDANGEDHRCQQAAAEARLHRGEEGSSE